MSFGGSSGSGSIHAGSDVALSNPGDGQVLGYSASLQKWQNQNSSLLIPTAVQTAAYPAASGDLALIDASAAAVTVTLPPAPPDRARLAVKKIDSTTNVVTVTAASGDVFNKAGGSSAISLSLLNQAVNLQYAASSGIWYVISGDIPLTQLDNRYAAQTDSRLIKAGLAQAAVSSSIANTTQTVDLTTGLTQTVTLATNCNFHFSNWPTGTSEVVMIVIQDNAGGHYASFTGITWIGAQPAQNITAGGISAYSLMSPDGGITIYGAGISNQFQGVSGQDVFDWLTANGVLAANIDSSGVFRAPLGLVTQNTLVTGSLQVAGKPYQTSTTTPAIANGAQASAASFTMSSNAGAANDVRGEIAVTALSSGNASGALCTITFASAWTTTPYIQLQAETAAAANLGLYVSARSATSFTISSANAAPASANIVLQYECKG